VFGKVQWQDRAARPGGLSGKTAGSSAFVIAFAGKTLLGEQTFYL
jgi:hypothetical protein